MFNAESFQAENAEKDKLVKSNPKGPVKIRAPKFEIIYVSICSTITFKHQSRYLGSGCSRHISEEKHMV